MRTRFKAISIALSLSVIVVMVPMETASGYDGDIHEKITWYAGEQFAKYYPNTEISTYLISIGYGAWEEDEVDLVFGYPGDFKTIPHFWNADGGPVDHVTCYLCGGIDEDWPNAWQKISYMGVGGYDTISPYGLWDQALLYYRSGNKEQAYSLLGHIAHLIQDMSVPAHVHEDSHATGDEYEFNVNMGWESVRERLDQDELNKGLIDYSNKPIPGWDPSLSAIYYLLYTTNQRTDFFGSEGEPGNTSYAGGDIVDPLGWADFSPFGAYSVMWYYQTPGNMEYEIWVCRECNTPLCRVDAPVSNCPNGHGWNASKMRAPIFISSQYLLPYAIRATATLFEVFLKAVHPTTHLEVGNNKYTLPDHTICFPYDWTVTLTAKDDVGVKLTEFRVTGDGCDSGWQIYSGPFTLSQLQGGLAEGEYTIRYRSTDVADQVEFEQSQDIILTSKPGDYRVSLSTGGSYLGIQAAIDAEPNGSTIEVKAGTFRECINFKGKAITLRGIGGPEVTTINADGGLHVVTFAKAEGANSILDGFTITGGNASGVGFPNDSGAGILCNETQPVIRNCIITNNHAAIDGGGIRLVNQHPVLQNCLIHHNSAKNGGGLTSVYSQPTVANCTFSANVAQEGLGGAIASFANGPGNTPILTNCILSGDFPWEIVYSTFSPIVLNSDVTQDAVWIGWNNLKTDPKFVDANNGNFRLAADSPCIGVGDNNATYQGETDLDGYPRKLDGRCDGTAIVDMGAYEFSYAYRGDLDTNCTVDFADLAILAAAWMHEPADRTIDIEPVPAGDGTVNILDFSILAEHWMKEI